MELLTPAGNWDSFLAGINNGADAVYMGGKNFSARHNAPNFTAEEIENALEYAHLRNKKLYLAVNTLIDYEEFDELLDYIYHWYSRGIDAVIVQDLGLWAMIKKFIPQLRIHASTQMTIHNSLGAKFLQEEGAQRLVLAREVALEELKKIRTQASTIELEVFVHGALCYAYSGQCLFSSMIGGRSGNRGRCAGTCRLPYKLYAQKEFQLATKGQYLISTADLCLIDYLADLKTAGVNSLKIEGRMKRAEYVAIVTKAYREALDRLDSFNADNIAADDVSTDNYANLLKVFNRNLSTGYLIKGKEAKFLSPDRPDNQGNYIGKIISQDLHYNTAVLLTEELNIGDGIEIGGTKGKDLGLMVKELLVQDKLVNTANKGDVVTIKLNTKVKLGVDIYKTHDVMLMKKASETITSNVNKIMVDVNLILTAGQALKLIMIDEQGHSATAYGSQIAKDALLRPLTEAAALDKIARLGDTPFVLRNFHFANPDNLIVSFSDLNDTRRRLSQKFLDVCLQKDWVDTTISRPFSLGEGKPYTNNKKPANTPLTKLSITTSHLEGARAAIAAGADIVYISLAGMGRHRKIKPEALLSLSEFAKENGTDLIPALPRIQNTLELAIGDDLAALGFKQFLVGNLGAFYWCQEHNLTAHLDYTFNIFNPYTLEFLLEKGGVSGCLSPELNLAQLGKFNDLSKAELIIHGELILMVSEYCMLSGILGEGKSHCKEKYCQKERYYIKDEKGYTFPLTTDNYCRFYLFNSRTLSMMENLDRLVKLNPHALRIEAYRLDSEQIAETVAIYKETLQMFNTGHKPDLLKNKLELEKVNNSPFTKGHYYRGVL